MKPSKPTEKKGAPAKAPLSPSKASKESADMVADVLASIRKELGEDGAQTLDDDACALKIRGVIPTSCATLDMAIGRGGFPLGRLSILHGGEGSGKTTLALHAVAECQQKDGLAVYFDKEYKLDPDYAERLGVQKDKLILSYPKSLEDFIDALNGVIEKISHVRKKTGRRKPVMAILDSLNACKTKAVLAGAAGDIQVAPEARVWSNQLPKIIESCSREDIALVFISQIRKKIGVMYGDSDTTAGGESPKFYASLILKVVRVGSEREERDGEKQKIANKIEVEAKKNQIAPPFKKAEFLITYGNGIWQEHALLKACLKLGIVEQSGVYLAHEGERIGQGIMSASKALRKQPTLREDLEKKFRAQMGW